MSLNHCMHPRNIYKNNPSDFKELSELYPEFRPFVKFGKSGKAVVNFRNPSTVRVLSQCLLHKDFKLNVVLPGDRLAPTVPSRLNYVLWIQDLLNAVGTKNPHVIDIGTGSSCIYPLLGVKLDPAYKFTATEIDEVNFLNATRNVELNSFEGCIRVMRVPPGCKTLLKHLFEGNTDKYDCCMCNPPFFSDYNESQAKHNRPVANSSCHAGYTEAITEGGDLNFATKLFEESLVVKDRVTWYTIMFGKKKSFVALKNLISKEDERNLFWTSYEFCQGNTVRWAIAWTFCSHLVDKSKIPESQLKLASKQMKSCKPILFTTSNPCSTASAWESVKSILETLGVSVCDILRNDSTILLKASAKEASWIHVRRRSRKRKLNGSPDVIIKLAKSLEIEPVLDFTIRLNSNDLGCVNIEFKTTNPNQKEILNGLVVYLKQRLLSEPIW